jgi:SAM-dependent methyltransferase
VARKFVWNSRYYIDDVEHGSDPGLQEYQAAEIEYITHKISSPAEKTFIDVGGGYGRILPHIAPIAKNVVVVELDNNLSTTLKERAQNFENCQVIVGDANELSELLSGIKLYKPVLLCLQNTLGPWVGDRNKVILEMKKVAEENQGEIIISLFCREAIENWGIPMYRSIARLLGNYDEEKSNLAKGIYKTDTGYESYWFSKEDRKRIKERLGGRLAGEAIDHKYHIIHTAYSL